MLGILIQYPALALIPSAVFAALYIVNKQRTFLATATVWALYAIYEYGMKWRVLCSGECNIRVDLLLIYPVLLIFTIYAVVVAVKRKTT